ncbi:MAG: hypothetical protein AAF483_09260 [Planctomycetota bacterium]
MSLTEEIQQHLDKALQFLKEKNFDDADFELSSAEEIATDDENGEHPLAWRVDVMMGRVAMEQGDFDVADFYFDGCESMPGAAIEEIQFWRGINQVREGKKQKGASNLLSAYHNGGEKLFEEVDAKYMQMVREQLEE